MLFSILALLLLVAFLAVLVWLLFFKYYPNKHSHMTRFHADHSRGPGAWGDLGETYDHWEHVNEITEDQIHDKTEEDVTRKKD